MSNIIQFKQKYIKLIACCQTCETTWTALTSNNLYKKRQRGERIKAICPFCQNTDIWFGKE